MKKITFLFIVIVLTNISLGCQNSQEDYIEVGNLSQIKYNNPLDISIELEKILETDFETGSTQVELSENLDGENTFTYTDIGIYTGMFEDNKRNGFGVFTWNNGDEYSGEWLDDKIHGDGIITFNDGSVLTASFSYNEIVSGQYEWSDNNGSYSFLVDKNNFAKIKILYNNGISYEGDFFDNNINGQGKIIYPGVGYYIGEFYCGMKQGAGEFYWNDKNYFSGVWYNDKMNGEGLYIYADGSTLTGNFSDNLPHGTLVYTQYWVEYVTEWYEGVCVDVYKK